MSDRFSPPILRRKRDDGWRYTFSDQWGQALSRRVSNYAQILTLLSFFSGLCSCSEERSVDQMGRLIEALRTQQWEVVQDYMNDQLAWTSFPLYKALKSGDKWVRLARVRTLDHHILFEIDLKQSDSSSSESRVSRHLFWATTSGYGQNSTGGVAQIGEIVGWSDPVEVSMTTRKEIPLTDLNAPSRFSATSYRELSNHQPQSSLAQLNLGVIGQKGSGSIESGWRASLSVSQAKVQTTEGKRSKRCNRLQNRWTKRLQVLKNALQERCQSSLLYAAQRSRYLTSNQLRQRVDVSRGRGGRSIREQQDKELVKKFQNADQKTSIDPLSDQKERVAEYNEGVAEHNKDERNKLTNGLEFSGYLRLSQDLMLSPEDRSAPRVSEAMIISPDLTTCVTSVTKRWSSNFLPQSPCRYQLSIDVEVNQSKSDTQ